MPKTYETGRFQTGEQKKDISILLVGGGGLDTRHAPDYVLAPPERHNEIRAVYTDSLLWAASNPGELSWAMRMIGSASTIFQSAQAGLDEHLATLDRLLLHLTHAGRFTVDRVSFMSSEDWIAWCSHLYELGRAALGHPTALSARWATLATNVDGISVDGHTSTVIRRGAALLKPPTEDATRVISRRARESSVAEIERLPPITFEVGNRVNHHGSTMNHTGFPEKFEVPSPTLRRYEGDIRVVERCLFTVEDMVAPESYRFLHEKQRRNPRLRDIDHEFAQVTNDWNESWDRLPGSYYHLDCSNSGHFGHLTTEVLSRLWAWDKAKEDDPDVKALFRIRRAGERYPQLEIDLFTAYGIPRDNIVWTPSPVRVDRLYAASPLWHNQFPHYADPRFKETWDRLAESLITRHRTGLEKIFVSRSSSLSNRGCRNTPEVEQWFSAQGFEIVYPERHSLAEQAEIFASANIVAGFAGSALFNVMFSKDLDKLIVLTHEAYTARNEYMYGALLGVETHYVWSKPDVSHPPGQWSESAYYSSFEFDLRSNLGALTKIIK